MNENCPCEAVRELKKTVEQHEKQLHDGNTSFALIKKDLEYIKSSLDRKSRFNSQSIAAVMQAICTLAVAIIAAKLGL